MVAALDEAYTQTHGKTLSKAAGIDGLKKNAAAGRAEALVGNLDWLPLPMRPAHHVAQPQEAAEPIKLPAAEAVNRTGQTRRVTQTLITRRRPDRRPRAST